MAHLKPEQSSKYSWIPLVMLAAVVIAASFPLWSKPAPFYLLDDGVSHLFHSFEFDRVQQQGVIYPRWAPDMVYGYGYPVFNFYPPLVYFLVQWFHILGLTINDAFKMTMVAIFTIGAAGAFKMGVEFFRDSAEAWGVGLLAALAYVFFPYFVLDIYIRGGIAEALAAALLPWLVWSVKRIFWQPTVAGIIFVGLSSAGLVMAHHFTALLASPFLAALSLYEWFRLPSRFRRRVLYSLTLAVLLGAMLSSIYWLPLIAEMPLVTIGSSKNAVALTGLVKINAFPVTQVIQNTLPYLYHYPAPYQLPMAAMSLGVVAWLIGVARRDSSVIFFGVTALAATILQLDWAVDFWLALPFLRSIQFPWRTSVWVGLAVAVCIGSLLHWASTLHWFRAPQAQPLRRVALYLLVAAPLTILLVWSSLANLDPEPQALHGEPDLGQFVRLEVNEPERGLGTMDEYLPLTVSALTPDLSSRSTASSSSRIELEAYSATERAFILSGSQSTLMSLRSFYFPDWHATIDGQPAAVFPSTPLGLSTVQVPPGEHRVVISLVDTPARQVGNLLTGLGLILVLGLTAGMVWKRSPEWQGVLAPVVLIAVGIALPTIYALNSHPTSLYPMHLGISPELDLIGLRIAGSVEGEGYWRVYTPQTALDLTAYWHVRQPPDQQMAVWRLVSSTGLESAKLTRPPRYGSGSPGAWVGDEVVEDHYDLPLPAGLPAGLYTLQAAFGDARPFVSVGSILLQGGSAPESEMPPELKRVSAQVGEHIQFLGYRIDSAASPGQRLAVTLCWRTDVEWQQDLKGFVQLLDYRSNLVAQNDGYTSDGFFPTTLWEPERAVCEQRSLRLPPNLSSGLYRLATGFYDARSLQRLGVTSENGDASPDDMVELGDLIVRAPTVAIRPEQRLDVALGSWVKLLGFDFGQTSESIGLKLYWQAVRPTNRDYKVFVHIIGQDGRIAAQKDQDAGGGRYPPRFWQVADTVTDSYEFSLANLAPGRYSIVVGMYDPASGERLTAVDGAGRELTDSQVLLRSFEATTR